jgi:hypothetical protein
MLRVRLKALEGEAAEDEYTDYLSKLCRQILDMITKVHSSSAFKVLGDEKPPLGCSDIDQETGVCKEDEANTIDQPMLQLGHSEL